METSFLSSNYDYNLPVDKIAKYPLANRDEAKLLVYNDGALSERVFRELPGILSSKSLLLFNNTKVIYARLFFKNQNGANIEIFCLEPADKTDYAQSLSMKNGSRWHCMIGNLRKWKFGNITCCIIIDNRPLVIEAQLIKKHSGYNVVEFSWPGNFSFGEILDKAGYIPIPPYLNRASDESDKLNYQTIYSKIEGSVAAPTAGLHFTDNVLKLLLNNNVVLDEVTLHVGAGTFKPLSSASIYDHTMHSEHFSVSLNCIKNIRAFLGNITAVGTTTVRTIESLYYIGCKIIDGDIPDNHIFNIDQWLPYKQNSYVYSAEESIDAVIAYLDINNLPYIQADTSIIIIPTYKHKITKRLLTNFHQPQSTLLLLLASFVGNKWREMYNYALEHDFRFLSYGDCCLII